MDYEKLIERLNNHLQSLTAYSDPELAHTLGDAATFLSALQAENKRLKSLLGESGQDLWSKENQRADCLEAQNEKLRAEAEGMRESLDFARSKDDEIVRLGLELEVRKRQEEAMNDIANDFQRQLHTALDELEQVKHQRDSYRLYHDDLASKPNCNTCADKDCKYRPIPGDTVRANCPLWRGPQKED